MKPDFATMYSQATDDDRATSLSQLLAAIAFHHLEEPHRWSLHTIYAARALAVARDNGRAIPTAGPLWVEILDRMERARRAGRAMPGKRRFFPQPMPHSQQLATLRGKGP